MNSAEQKFLDEEASSASDEDICGSDGKGGKRDQHLKQISMVSVWSTLYYCYV
jgi:hypothetical protein